MSTFRSKFNPPRCFLRAVNKAGLLRSFHLLIPNFLLGILASFSYSSGGFEASRPRREEPKKLLARTRLGTRRATISSPLSSSRREDATWARMCSLAQCSQRPADSGPITSSRRVPVPPKLSSFRLCLHLGLVDQAVLYLCTIKRELLDAPPLPSPPL